MPRYHPPEIRVVIRPAGVESIKFAALGGFDRARLQQDIWPLVEPFLAKMDAELRANRRELQIASSDNSRRVKPSPKGAR